MRRIWIMVRKDLRRQVRSPLAMLMVLAFPIIFSLLLALAFGTGDVKPPQVRLLVEDRDQTFLSDLLVGAFESDQAGRYFETREVGEEGAELMERGEASALLIIPEKFAEDLIEGRPVVLRLVRNPAESILPEIAEQTMTVLTDVLSAGSAVLREPLDRMAPMFRDEEERPTAAQVAEISTAFYDAISGAERFLIPPVVTLEVVQLEGEDSSSSGSSTGSIFLLILPGVSVWALFALGDQAMRDILTEITAGTLRRQLSGPLPAWKLVLGKALYTAVLASISLVLLSAIGALVARRPIDPLGFVLLSASVIVAVTGWASVVYGLARTASQGATLSSILLLAFAFVGGAFIPLDSLPAAVRGVAPFTPFYWGTVGYQDLIQRGGSWIDVLPSVGVLSAAGSVLLFAGAALLGRRVSRGAAA